MIKPLAQLARGQRRPGQGLLTSCPLRQATACCDSPTPLDQFTNQRRFFDRHQ
jgi:hypothetical protein